MKVRNCILFACIICLCFSIYGVLDNKVNAEESVYPMWYKIFTKHNSTFTPTLVDDTEVKWNEEYKAVELISKESGEYTSWDPYIDYYGLNYSSGDFDGVALEYKPGITIAARVFVPETVVVENPDLEFSLRGLGNDKELLKVSQSVSFRALNGDGSVKKGVWQTVYATFNTTDNVGKEFTGLRISYMKKEGNADMLDSEKTLFIQSICIFDTYDKAIAYYEGGKPVVHTQAYATTNGETTTFNYSVYPVDTKYTVTYSSKTNEEIKDVTTLPTEEGEYLVTFTLEEGTWAQGFSSNNTYTTELKIVSSLPSSEYLVIESEDDVDIWFKDNLNNIPADALSFDSEKKAAKITFNRAMSDPGIYIRGLDVFGEDYPYIAINIEVKGNGSKGRTNNLYVWGEDGLVSTLGAGKLKEGSYTVCYDLRIEGSPYQLRWDPFVVIPDGFDVEVYIKYIAFFKSAEAALAFDGDFSVIDNGGGGDEKTPTPDNTTPQEERTPKPLETTTPGEDDKESKDDSKKSNPLIFVIIGAVVVIAVAVVVILVLKKRKR